MLVDAGVGDAVAGVNSRNCKLRQREGNRGRGFVMQTRRENTCDASDPAPKEAQVAAVIELAGGGARRVRDVGGLVGAVASVFKYAVIQPRWPQISSLGFWR